MNLELIGQCELDQAAAEEGGGDFAEGGRIDTLVAHEEAGVVLHIGGVAAQLDGMAFGDLDVLQDG